VNLYAKLREREAQGGRCASASSARASLPRCISRRRRARPACTSFAIADLSPAAAHANLERVGWIAESHAAASIDAARGSGARTCRKTGRRWSRTSPHIVIEATGNPIARIGMALAAFRHRKHVINGYRVRRTRSAGPCFAREAGEARRRVQPGLRQDSRPFISI